MFARAVMAAVLCAGLIPARVAASELHHGTRQHDRKGRAQRKPQRLPQTLSDKNGDGVITVCLAGDSKMAAIDTRLATLLEQPQNILQCARTSATTLDLYNHIDAVLDGTGDAFEPCRALKGKTGYKCDYLVYETGVNSFHSAPPQPPREGVCYDNGGPHQGEHCRCDWEWQFENRTPYYCRQGADFLQECLPLGFGPPRKGCTGETFGEGCEEEPNPAGWCTMGCRDSAQCPGGLCAHEPDMARHLLRQRAIMDKIEAHPSHATIVLVLAALTLPKPGCWGRVSDNLAAIRAFYQEEARNHGYNFIDLREEFHDKCIPLEKCYLDPVHYSVRPGGGVEVLIHLVEACLEERAGFKNASCGHL